MNSGPSLSHFLWKAPWSHPSSLLCPNYSWMGHIPHSLSASDGSCLILQPDFHAYPQTTNAWLSQRYRQYLNSTCPMNKKSSGCVASSFYIHICRRYTEPSHIHHKLFLLTLQTHRDSVTFHSSFLLYLSYFQFDCSKTIAIYQFLSVDFNKGIYTVSHQHSGSSSF